MQSYYHSPWSALGIFALWLVFVFLLVSKRRSENWRSGNRFVRWFAIALAGLAGALSIFLVVDKARPVITISWDTIYCRAWGHELPLAAIGNIEWVRQITPGKETVSWAKFDIDLQHARDLSWLEQTAQSPPLCRIDDLSAAPDSVFAAIRDAWTGAKK